MHCFVWSELWTSKEGIASVDHVLQWNTRMHGQFLQTKSWVPSLSFVIVYTERGQWHASFIREKLAYLAEVSVMEQISRKISKFPEILEELSMRKQCVPGSFFSAHAQEPGNESNILSTWHHHTSRLSHVGLYLQSIMQSIMQSNTGDNEGMRLRSGGSWVNMFI